MIGLRSPSPSSRRQDGARDVCPAAAVAATRAEDRRGRSGDAYGSCKVCVARIPASSGYAPSQRPGPTIDQKLSVPSLNLIMKLGAAPVGLYRIPATTIPETRAVPELGDPGRCCAGNWLPATGQGPSWADT